MPDVLLHYFPSRTKRLIPPCVPAQIFVYGIGRFLRLSVSNLRMRIPFEDVPNPRRLVALGPVREWPGGGWVALIR